MALLPGVRDGRGGIVNRRWYAGIAVMAGLAVGALALAVAQEEPSERLVAAGHAVYHGIGTCHICHGDDGRGLPRLGSNLTDAEWTFADGSLPSIATLIEEGLSAERSTHGMPMPPRAGARLTDRQIHAVSTYVWSLSRRPS